MEFQFELGNTLHSTLRKFPSDERAPSFLINTHGTDYALEIFFALYNRDYIKNIDIDDHLSITVERIDYIEHKK